MKKCYLWVRERLVYEGEEWGIITDDDPTRLRTYASHQACTISYAPGIPIKDGSLEYGCICWMPGNPNAVCGNCKQSVPEGIQGLVIMMEWDK